MVPQWGHTDRRDARIASQEYQSVALSDEETRAAYLAAWEDWQKKLQHVHRVFLEGESIRPEQIKGLLNREARKKAVYDEARDRLLGIHPAEAVIPTGNENPFKTD